MKKLILILTMLFSGTSWAQSDCDLNYGSFVQELTIQENGQTTVGHGNSGAGQFREKHLYYLTLSPSLTASFKATIVVGGVGTVHEFPDGYFKHDGCRISITVHNRGQGFSKIQATTSKHGGTLDVAHASGKLTGLTGVFRRVSHN